MRWLATWTLLTVTLTACSASPKREAAYIYQQSPLRKPPVIEDDLIKDEVPQSGLERNRPNMESDGFVLEEVNDNRYIGYCEEAYILMWPGNSRKFWSYGYVYLVEPYLANCTMKYYYNTRNFPGDPFARFGFTVTGSFEGQTGHFADCTQTDYVLLNDTDGNAKYYCGPNSTIEWATSQSDFEFHFVTKPNSPRGRGFFVNIQSYKLCGGSYSMENDGPTGNIYSPLFPLRQYSPNLSCTYYFVIEKGVSKEISVKMGCSVFSLQPAFNNGTEYCLDVVTFMSEVPGNTTSYCSNTLNNNTHMIYSTHNDLLVSFRTDGSVQDTGFNCTYEYILYAE